MKVLVTGGSGFIGSHVVDAAVAAGHEVTSLDRRAVAPEVANPGARYLVGDLTDPSTVRQAVAAAGGGGLLDAVSHQAARVGLEHGAADGWEYVADNGLATARLLAGLAEAGFTGRVVLASSMVVYGEGSYTCPDHATVRPPPRSPRRLEDGCFEPQCPRCGADLEPGEVDEDAVADPRNVYSATKLHQEHLVAVLARRCGMSQIALRYHNVYGPRMPLDTPYSGVAARFRSALVRGEAPRVFEDGRQRRDFVHVADVAAANLAALVATGVDGPFNVASGRPRSVGDMARVLARVVGSAHGRSGAPIEPVVTGEYRLGDVRHIVASPARARERLGFVASVDFEAGMAELAGEVDGSSPDGQAER